MTNTGRMFLDRRLRDNRNDRMNDGGTHYDIYRQDAGARNNDYGMHTDYAGNPDYGRGYADGLSDGRRGVKGTGPYGRDYGEDSRDYNTNYDSRDYNSDIPKLTHHDFSWWKNHLENDDGTTGPRFDVSQTTPIAERLGIKFNHYTPEEFCMTMNMFYSDFCTVFRNFIPQEREATEYAKIAKRFLDDKDASVKGSDKLAIYYHCIVKKP
jgi:hypothetical protein